MNTKASVRKKRNDIIIQQSKKDFSHAIHEKDHELASHIVFTCTMQILGRDGLMKALRRGNSYYQRKQRRSYL